MKVKTQQQRDLKERAARLGYKLRRRGTEYNLVDYYGAGFGGAIESVIYWLDVIENKTPVQVSTACGMPLYEINGDVDGSEHIKLDVWRNAPSAHRGTVH
jgi:hypothetical protein